MITRVDDGVSKRKKNWLDGNIHNVGEVVGSKISKLLVIGEKGP